MARYKKYCYDQGKFSSIHLHKQISEGTFEYTSSYLIDNEVDLAPFDNKYKKMETAVRKILKKHREVDIVQSDQKVVDREKQCAHTLKNRIKKIKSFLADNQDKIGKSGKPIQCDITDNDSAKQFVDNER